MNLLNRVISRTGQGNEVAFWCWSMVVRCRTEDAACPTTATPIAPGRATASPWLRPDVIAIGAGLAMWARAGVLTGASVDQAHAMQHGGCREIGVHGIPMLCSPVVIAGHSTADASGHAASGEQCKYYRGGVWAE